MSTTWTNIDDVLSDGKTTSPNEPGHESAVRDSEKWCLFNSNSSEAEMNQQLKETKEPQELRVLPGDMDIFPDEIQSGECDWTLLPDPE